MHEAVPGPSVISFSTYLVAVRACLPSLERAREGQPSRVVREEPRPRLCWVHRGKEEPQVRIWKWMPLKLPLPAGGWHAPPIPSVSLSVRRRAGPEPCPSCLAPPKGPGGAQTCCVLAGPPPAPQGPGGAQTCCCRWQPWDLHLVQGTLAIWCAVETLLLGHLRPNRVRHIPGSGGRGFHSLPRLLLSPGSLTLRCQ